VIQIEVNPQYITIEKFRVPKPVTISVTTWMEYWEEHLRGTYADGYERCRIDHEIIE
jgi:hypothetical protein